MRARILASCGGIALALLGAEPAVAGDCAGLATAALPDAELTSVALQPAGPFNLPAEFGPATTIELPSFCRVQGVLRPAADRLNLDETLKEHVKQKIGPWKYPRWIDVVDSLPKTATGKIQRFKLREGETAKS